MTVGADRQSPVAEGKVIASHSQAGFSQNYNYVVQRAIELAGSKAARVLDYGCGKGRVVAIGRAKGYDFHGADTFSELYKNWSKDIVDGAGNYCTKIEDGRIAAEDNSFDVVVSNQVFEHVFEPETALSEIARVLKPGGKFLALFPTYDIWLEGHLGIYFVHWLPARSSTQLQYLRALRRMGFGFYKGNRNVDQWAQHGQKVLNEAVVYRKMREIDRLWRVSFGASPRSEAADYMRFRLNVSRYKKYAPLADWPLASPFLSFICHKRAGRVLVVENRK